ncbi:MAG: SDR family oxidoreductase [Patescibacteria group bacterium]|nr:SDR family oxidoreductase [Patescibacteria group bacterium]
MKYEIFKIINSKGTPFLKNKVALINGLDADIGKIIGEALLENGAFVTGTYFISKKLAEEVIKKYGKNKVKIFKIDLTLNNYEREIKKIVEQTFRWKKRIDILVNVSGIWMITPFLYETEEDRKRVWRINYEGHVVFSQEVIKKMLATGSGDIINIASTAGVRGAGQQTAYCASKSAVINFTKSLAEEFGPKHIKVNSISPGPVDTKALSAYLDNVAKELVIKNIPKSRLCYPIDVANAVLGILINDYMTGENIILHGGKL